MVVVVVERRKASPIASKKKEKRVGKERENTHTKSQNELVLQYYSCCWQLFVTMTYFKFVTNFIVTKQFQVLCYNKFILHYFFEIFIFIFFIKIF